MDIGKRRIDRDKREKGDWVDLKDHMPSWEDLRLKVRGMNNSDYSRRSGELSSEVMARYPDGVPPDEAARVETRLLCDTCLIGWENLSIDGREVPYSKEQAEALANDEAFTEFWEQAVRFAAAIVARRRKEASEGVLGNF